MGTIRRRGRGWRAEVYRKGVRESSTHATRQEAVDWVVQRESELLRGATGRTHQSLSDALAHFRAGRTLSRSDETRLRCLGQQRWASLPLSDLTTETIAAWRDERLKTVKPSTVRRELTTLRSVLELARLELKWVGVNPVRDVRKPGKVQPRVAVISDGDRDALVAALGYDLQKVETIGDEAAVALLLALETAMRAGELLALRWADVDTGRRVATLHKSKTGPGRAVPLSGRALVLLEQLRRKKLLRVRNLRDPELVFHIDSDSLDVVFRRARRKAGLHGFTFHDSRRTALTRLSQKFTALELARISGHSNLSQLLTYYSPPIETFAERMG